MKDKMTLKVASQMLGKNFRTWGDVSCYPYLSEDFLNLAEDKLAWGSVCRCNQMMTENFIREHAVYVNWLNLCRFHKLSEPFMEEFKDKIDWEEVSRFQTLSIDFMRKYQDRLDWSAISRSQTITEELVAEFADRVNWCDIHIYENLSEDFLRKYEDRVYWGTLLQYNRNLSHDFRTEFVKKYLLK